MGSLTAFLQKAFLQDHPSGWECSYEESILDLRQEGHLGYSPRADVLLAKQDGSLRLWIEFEVSRADPVANHAKFATAHIFFPRPQTDIFLSMVSSHVSRGRSNLAANTIWLMRQVGLTAFQTTLLPHYDPQTIFRLNHLALGELGAEMIPVQQEIERAVTVTQPLTTAGDRDLYFVANLMDVMHNVAQWNRDIKDPAGRAAWGRRRITYFVYNRFTREFAPSKFCAYSAVKMVTPAENSEVAGATMTIPVYAQILWENKIFDGNRARKHLEDHLAMRLVEPSSVPGLGQGFDNWYEQHQEVITMPENGFGVLIPPGWY